MKSIYYLIFILAIFFAQCKTYETDFFFLRAVNLKDTTVVIPGATIFIQGQELTTNNDGKVDVSIDLDRFILDRLPVLVRANGYQDYQDKILVGKDQQETINLPLRPENGLIYNPFPVMTIDTNETFGDLAIDNLGLDFVPVEYSVGNFTWIGLNSMKDTVSPDSTTYLRITPSVGTKKCRDQGYITVRWDKNNVTTITDTITVIKKITDKEKPVATFGFSPSPPILQFTNITFDASQSTDNCKIFFPLQYNWSFDNQTTWTGFDTSYVTYKYAFGTTGQKTVWLQVRDGAGNVSQTDVNLDISLPPTPPLVGNPTVSPGSELLSVNLSAFLIGFGQTFNSVVDHGFIYSFADDTPTFVEDGESFDPTLGSNNNLGSSFSATYNNLLPTRYYIRAYAKNAGGLYGYSDATIIYDVKIVDFVQTGGISGGQFAIQRGDDSSPFPNEKPESLVTLNNFKISQTEVTNAQYVVYLNANNIPLSQGAVFLDITNAACRIGYTNKWEVDNGFENHPVNCVSWEGARRFCNWIDNGQGRLPTEAEWEAAARAGLIHPHPQWSGSTTAPNLVAVYNANSSQILKVKSRQPNTWGLCDMSGNVAEWCSDWYEATYSIGGGIPTNPQGPPSSPFNARVIRGGSFLDGPNQVTVTYRNFLNPLQRRPEVGFRVVKQ